MRLGDVFGRTSSPDFLPKYHGAEGDTRYPSPRGLRSAGAALIDFGLQFGSFFVAIAVTLTLMVKLRIPEAYSWPVMLLPVVVIVGNRILLPKWVHASVGESIFGLVEIRGSDGAWLGWGDLWSAGFGNSRVGVPIRATVRRCDVSGRDMRLRIGATALTTAV